MANDYGVTPYARVSGYSGYSKPVSLEATIAGKQIPIAVLQRALSFLDPASWEAVPFVNKAFYQAARGKVFLLHFAQEEEAKGKMDSYQIKRTINREEAEAIFTQTGYEIRFVPGQAQVKDFKLGRGAFGEFCIARSATKANYVGVKITRGRDASEREAKTQLALSGLPYIMPALDLCKAKDPTGSPALYQVMELGGLGSTAALKKHLDNVVDLKFKQQVLFCITEGLIVGLGYMHKKGYYHLDMKPDNVVVRQDGQQFLIDFGCSVYSPNPIIDTSKLIGDLAYFSPERGGTCDATKIDAWAAGITLLILGGFAALPTSTTFDEADMARGVSHVQKEGVHAPTNSFLALVYALLQTDPAKRLSPTQALRHPWFMEMQKTSVEWRADTVAYLREFVQSLQRESRSGVSPQDLPLPHFAAYVERTALKESLQKHLLSPLSYEKSIVTVCQGMGGVGKTQFVTHLIHQRRVQTHFGVKLWFRSSDNRSYLETQMIMVAHELRLVDEKASFEQAQQRLYQYLARQTKPWLIVFDNADSPDMLTPFLPPSGGHILITSRSTTWPEAIPIDVFSPEESIVVVQKLLQKEEPQAKELCQELGYLPLGIVQACAFIRNQKLSVVAYLEQLRKNAALVERDEQLFGKKLPNSMLSLWQATFQALDPQARALLDIVAYLAPESIPPTLMQKLGSYEARASLKQYALLHENAQGFCNIHRLVQLAARSKFQSVNALVKGMSALYECYELNPNSQEMETNAQLLPHGEAMQTQAKLNVSIYPELRASLAKTYIWLSVQQGILGHFSAAKVFAEKALQIAQQTHSDTHPDIALALTCLGNAMQTLGEEQQALKHHNEALVIRKKVYGEQHPDVATSLNNIGKALMTLGHVQNALQYYEKALIIFRKIHGEQHPNVATSLNNIGRAWCQLENGEKSLHFHRQALDIRRTLYGELHPDVAISLNNIGVALDTLGDVAQQALQHYKQALEIIRKVHGELHPKAASYLINIGSISRALGDPLNGLKRLEQALAILKKFFGEKHPLVATCLIAIGETWTTLKDADEALEHFEQALDIQRKMHGELHPDVATSLYIIGTWWISLDAQQALQLYKQALAIQKKVHGEQHPSVATSINEIGVCWMSLGYAKQALQCYKQALAIRKNVHGEHHPNVAKSIYCIGQAYFQLQDRAQAIHYCQAAYQMALQLPRFGPDHPDTELYKKWLDKAISIPEKKKCVVM